MKQFVKQEKIIYRNHVHRHQYLDVLHHLQQNVRHIFNILAQFKIAILNVMQY